VNLPAISAEHINAEHRLAREAAGSAVEHVIACGRLLLDVKASLKHGEFGRWVEANCDFSYRTARAYIRATQKAAQNGSALPFSSLRQALEWQPDEPQHTRDPEPLPIDGQDITDLMALRGQTFGCIYADPPWRYGNQGTRAATGNHYVGLSVEEICALPIGELAAERSHLHLWTTNGFLFDAQRVMQAWGFEHKSCFVWVKPQMGIGNYWRVSHEFLLLGARGGITFADRSLMSWAAFDRTRHSEKPEEIRQFIERASPGPHLELFARRPAKGWTVWGNEIKRDLAAA